MEKTEVSEAEIIRRKRISEGLKRYYAKKSKKIQKSSQPNDSNSNDLGDLTDEYNSVYRKILSNSASGIFVDFTHANECAHNFINTHQFMDFSPDDYNKIMAFTLGYDDNKLIAEFDYFQTTLNFFDMLQKSESLLYPKSVNVPGVKMLDKTNLSIYAKYLVGASQNFANMAEILNLILGDPDTNLYDGYDFIEYQTILNIINADKSGVIEQISKPIILEKALLKTIHDFSAAYLFRNYNISEDPSNKSVCSKSFTKLLKMVDVFDERSSKLGPREMILCLYSIMISELLNCYKFDNKTIKKLTKKAKSLRKYYRRIKSNI